MYLLMIRPQRKREKQINQMRSSLKVGDQITTIGGIRGKIITVRDDALIIAVGADKVKIEVMRWAISKIDTEAAGKPAPKTADKKEDETKEEDKPARKPRKLGAKPDAEADSGENADDSGEEDGDEDK
jgi:preprotein translocase YajC subunit